MKKLKWFLVDGFNSMIYLENNDLLVFGDNYYGQLGLGHTWRKKLSC